MHKESPTWLISIQFLNLLATETTKYSRAHSRKQKTEKAIC